MAGIYIHIPFCKQACHYCNFHFTTSLRYKTELIEAIKKELYLRKDYLRDEIVETIYFGGGTPSLLTKSELSDLFNTIHKLYKVNPESEVTLESNPDDLSLEYLDELKQTPINRLSIGVQSFFENDLIWMNRAHNAEQAHNAIKWALEAGFDNLSIDLIYGSPTTSDEQWIENIKTAIGFNIPHISSYCLTVEPKTPLDKMLKAGKSLPVTDDKASTQFGILIDLLENESYEQYEISNFAKNQAFAKHNTAYWQSKKYLGVGPSAHSFDGITRSWNIANNMKYMDAINNATIPLTLENLSKEEIYNESLMTGLRTMWGVSRYKIAELDPIYLKQLDTEIKYYIDSNYAILKNDHYVLTRAGKFLADRIASDLFIV